MARCNGSQLDEIRGPCTGASGGGTGGRINESMHDEGELYSNLLLEGRSRRHGIT